MEITKVNFSNHYGKWFIHSGNETIWTVLRIKSCSFITAFAVHHCLIKYLHYFLLILFPHFSPTPPKYLYIL